MLLFEVQNVFTYLVGQLAAWNYCMSVGLAFYEHHVLPSTGNGDPDAIVGYVPCMRLQNWTGEIVDMSKERPRGADQHVGAKGTI